MIERDILGDAAHAIARHAQVDAIADRKAQHVRAGPLNDAAAVKSNWRRKIQMMKTAQRASHDLVVDRIDAGCLQPDQQIAWIYRLTLGRNPGPAEARRLAQFAAQNGLENTARAILNSNEFLFAD